MSRALSVGTKVWANRIAAIWQSSIEAILETGRLLAAAKAELQHGDFERMIDRELPFKPTTAQRLMKIARDKRIAAHGQLLPASWRTLYELTKLKDDQFGAAVQAGTINPEMERADVAKLKSVSCEPAPTVTDAQYEDVPTTPRIHSVSLPPDGARAADLLVDKWPAALCRDLITALEERLSEKREAA